MNTLHACLKMIRIAAHMFRGLATVTFVFSKLSQTQKEQRIQSWARSLLSYSAIQCELIDQPTLTTPSLLAANHVSWLDVYVILAICPCRFVAKSEVRQWPLIGSLAASIGTLFVVRQSPRDAVRVVHKMTEHLRQGDTLAIFPEGTTSNGLQVLPFHANLFQAAISADVPVQAVALQYQDATTQRTSLAPCYIDDDTLLGAIWRTLTAPPLRVKVSFAPSTSALGRDRRRLASDVRESIVKLL